MKRKETQNKIVDAISPFTWLNTGNNSMGGSIIPRLDKQYDIGSESSKIRTLYVDRLFVNQLDVTQVDSTGVDPGTGGTADLTDVVLRDGSQSLLGNLAVSSGVTIDGVDISVHAANATGGSLSGLTEAHHNRAHLITSTSDHTISAAEFSVVGATALNTLGTIASNFDVTGISTTTFLRSTASADPGGAGGVSLNWIGVSDIRAASSVNITLTPGASGSVLIPNAKTMRSVSFNPASIPYTGWSIHPRTGMASQSEMILNRIIADELRVKIFVADETRVDRGTLYITKGYGLTSRPFTTPGSIGGTATIYFENSASITGALFSSSVDGSPATSTTGDWLMLQLVDFSGGGANIAWFWGRVYNYTLVRAAGTDSDDDPGEQSWTFILKAGDNNVVLPVGAFALNFGQPGQGYIKIDAVSTSFVPAISILVWGLDVDGDPLPTSSATPYGAGGPDDGAAKNVAHMGMLYNALDNDLGIVDGTYGFFSTNAYLRGVLRTANTLIDEKGAQIFTPTQSDFDSFNVFGFRKDAVTDNPLYAYTQGYWDTSNVKIRLIAYDTAETRDSTVFIQSFSGGSNQSLITLQARNLDTDDALGGAIIAMTSTAADSGSIEIWAENVINIRVLGASGGSATHRVNIEGDLVPIADYTYDLGSISGTNKRWRTIYAQSIVVDSITSGETLSGQEWEYPGSMKIDANHASDTTVTIVNDGTGVASLAVEGAISAGTGLSVTGNITVTGNVDGVDLGAFKTAYDTHAGNATGGSLAGLTEAHHNRSHNIESASDHVISGETTGHVLRVIDGGLNTFGFGTILSTAISDFKEAVEDYVGSSAFMVDTSTINWTYSDITPSLTADVIPGGIDHGQLAASSLLDDDHTQYMHNTTARTVTAIHTLSNGVVIGLGDAATPTVRFSGDLNTGMFSAGADQVSFSTDGTQRVNITTSIITSTLPLRASDGSIGAPTYGFTSDIDTGVYLVSDGVLGFTVAGAQRLSMTNATATFTIAISGTSAVFSGNASAANLSSTGYVRAGDGSNTAPSFSFTSDTNTGMYSGGADAIAFTVGGADRFTLTTTTASVLIALAGTSAVFSGDVSAANLTSTGYVRTGNGTEGAPTHSFTLDSNTGMFSSAADTLGFSTGGTERLTLATTTLTSTVKIIVPVGTEGAPSVTFAGDTDTGIWGSATGSILFSSNAALKMGIASTAIAITVPMWAANGTASAPSYTFGSDSDTGVFLSSVGNLGLSADAAEVVLISSGNVLIDENLDVNTRVRVPLITTVSGVLTLDADSTIQVTDGTSFRSQNYMPGFVGSGWDINQGITYTGLSYAEFDNMTIRGRLNVYELMIQQIRATNGNIFVSSTLKVDSVDHTGGTFGVAGSTYRLHVAEGDLVTVSDNDILRAQRWAGGSQVYVSNIHVTDVALDLSYVDVTLLGSVYPDDGEPDNGAPQAGFDYARLGNTTDVNRQGGVYLSGDDAGAPFIQIWNGVNEYTDWNTAGVIKTHIGRLDAITGSTNEYGFIAGVSGLSSTSGVWVKASSSGVVINNADLKVINGGAIVAQIIGSSTGAGNMYLGSTDVTTEANRTLEFIASTGALRVGRLASNQGNMTWDAGTLSIRMNTTPVITLDSSGNSYFAGRMTIGASGEIIQGSGTPGAVGAAIASWGTTYTGIRIGRIGTIGVIAGYTSSVAQWYGSTDGKFYAGTGNVVIDAEGISLQTRTTYTNPINSDIRFKSGATQYGMINSDYSGVNTMRIGIYSNIDDNFFVAPGSNGEVTIGAYRLNIAGDTARVLLSAGTVGDTSLQLLLHNENDTNMKYLSITAPFVSVSGPIREAVGSVGAPTYTFTGATNYGMYYASSAIRFAVAGANEMTLDGTQLTLAGGLVAGGSISSSTTISATTGFSATAGGSPATYTPYRFGGVHGTGLLGSPDNYVGLAVDDVFHLLTRADGSSDSFLRLGYGIAADRNAHVDFHANALDPTAYSARIIRATGANGALTIAQVGTGNVIVQTGGSTTATFVNSTNSLTVVGTVSAATVTAPTVEGTSLVTSDTLVSAPTVTASGNLNGAVVRSTGAGAVGSPSFTWSAATTSGMYRATNEVNFAVAGTERLSLTATGAIVTGTFSATGLISAPAGVSGTSGSFSGVVTGSSGTFSGAVSGTTFTASAGGSSGSAAIGWSTGAGIYKTGIRAVLTSDTAWALVADNAQAKIQDGTVALPALAFEGDPNTGIYSSTADRIDFSVGASNTFSILTTATVSTVKFHAPDGGVSGPGYTFSSDPDTGFYKSGTGSVRIAAQSVDIGAFALNGTAAGQLGIACGDNGASNGGFLSLARNTNATTPAGGHIRFTDRGGTTYYVHADDAGVLRIGTTNPTSATDTTNTVVGTQSSLSVKDILGEASIEDALAGIADGAAGVRRYQYKEVKAEDKKIKAVRPFNGEEFSGIVVDFAPRYGQDKSKENPHGSVLNISTAIGDLMLVSNWAVQKLNNHEDRIAKLEKLAPTK